MAIISCTLPLAIEHVEIPLVVVTISVKALEKPIILKPIPLVIPKIRVGAKVILIDNITHAFKVFRIFDIVINDTCY